MHVLRSREGRAGADPALLLTLRSCTCQGPALFPASPGLERPTAATACNRSHTYLLRPGVNVHAAQQEQLHQPSWPLTSMHGA